MAGFYLKLFICDKFGWRRNLSALPGLEGQRGHPKIKTRAARLQTPKKRQENESKDVGKH